MNIPRFDVDRNELGSFEKDDGLEHALAQRKAIGGNMVSARNTTLAMAAALAVSAFATAGPPTVGIDVNIDGTPNPFAPGNITGPFGSGVYNFVGNGNAGLGNLTTWNFNATNSTEVNGGLVFVSGNFTFENTSNATQVYDVLVTLATTPAGTSSKLGGSVAGGLTADFDGGTLSRNSDNDPLWTAAIDGNEVGHLLANMAPVTAAPFDSNQTGGDAFGMPIPSLAGPALGNEMTIRLRFELTAGDQASFTSVFVLEVVPAPAAGLAFIGLAGLTSRRRRA